MSLIRPFDACPSCHHGIVVHEPSGCVGAYGRWWDPDTNAIVGSYYSPKEPDCGCRGSDEPPVRHYVSPHTTRKGSVWCSGCHDWRVNCVHLRGGGSVKQVAENLWMGGLDHGAKTSDGFTAIVALDRKAPTYDPLLQVRWPIGDWVIRDQHDPARFVENLYAVSSFVWVLLDGGHKVLVHCLKGRNRSALVCAKVLILQGVPAEEAVLRIRALEPQALTNDDFLSLLVAPVATQA